jgi:hypothetical protein
MSTTPNLLLNYVVPSQNNKEATVNQAILGLEEALTDNAAVVMIDADYTFATGQGSLGLSSLFFKFTGPLTAGRNVILPPNAKPFIVVNATTASGSPLAVNPLTFKVGTGTHTVTISDGDAHLIYSDGVNSVYQVS